MIEPQRLSREPSFRGQRPIAILAEPQVSRFKVWGADDTAQDAGTVDVPLYQVLEPSDLMQEAAEICTPSEGCTGAC